MVENPGAGFRKSLAATSMLVAASFALQACNETTGGGGNFSQDQTPPTVSVAGLSDTVRFTSDLNLTLRASDNLGLSNVNLTVARQILLSIDSSVSPPVSSFRYDTISLYDTTFTSTQQDFEQSVPVLSGSGGTLVVDARALDGNQNEATFSDTIFAQNLADVLSPQLQFVQPDSGALLRIGDSIRVAVQITDIGGLASIRLDGVAHRGDVNLGTNTVVQRLDEKQALLNGATDTLVMRDLVSPEGDPTSEPVYVRVFATDIEGNVGSDSVLINLVTGPRLEVIDPAPNSVTAPGNNITVVIRAESPATGVRQIGYVTRGVLVTADTLTAIPISNPQPRIVVDTFTLAVPAGTAFGTFTLDAFGRDSAGNLGAGAPVTVEVVDNSSVADVGLPVVTDSLDRRVEVDDSIRIRANDPEGSPITSVRLLVRTLGVSPATITDRTVSFATNSADVSTVLGLNLFSITTFPTQVEVIIRATDAAGNIGGRSHDGETPVSSGSERRDTITVVAGRTVNLPAGGSVADAIYNVNRNEVYFTNTDLDRLEVFNVATATFDPNGISVGSSPWGIALWPSDTLGNNLNRVVVANSGGTNFSIVDVAAGTELRRHHLPQFVVSEVSIEVDDAAPRLIVTDHDFSDRPQFVGTVCRPVTGGTSCHADSIYALYTTAPTIDQGQFTLRGTMRWENISDNPPAPESHFFYEHAAVLGGVEGDVDTLQIEIFRQGGSEIQVSAACGVIVSFDEIPFLDTTFVRNSGNFTHGFFGEGGSSDDPPLGFSRALAYRVGENINRTNCSATLAGVTFAGPVVEDEGVSPAARVVDFISNTATKVSAVAVNFNGLTNLVRAGDSIYVVDEDLRLTGTIAADGLNPGIDLNFDHDFDARIGGTPGTSGGTGSPNDRILFAARGDANIDIFDSWFFGRVSSVPIKEPIIGPLRVAELPSGDQYLIGATASGIVTVTLPPVTNIFQMPESWGAPVP